MKERDGKEWISCCFFGIQVWALSFGFLGPWLGFFKLGSNGGAFTATNPNQ